MDECAGTKAFTPVFDGAMPAHYDCASGHPFHRAPAFQRGPDAAFEPEAVDRHRGAERADTAEADAVPLEAALLQDAARARIGHAHARLQRLVLEIGERVIDQRAHGFGGVALAPVSEPKPVADLRRR